MIPKTKMDESCEYKKDENVYIIKGNNDLRIDKGSKVRCKCFESNVEFSNYYMYDRFSNENSSLITKSPYSFYFIMINLINIINI